MASINFSTGTTVTSTWLNDVDALVWDVFNGKTTAGTSGTLLRSNGTNIVNTTATYPSTAGTSGTILRSDGTNIVNSTATYPATAGTANTVLKSNGTNIVNSTATFPDTTTANQLLYSSATNTVGGLATANSSVLVTSGAGVPSLSTTLPNGVTATTQAATDSSTLLATTAFVQSLLLPTATILDIASSSVPTGWLECDGSTVSTTTYAALYAILSTTWNKGGEAGGTFRLPDFRGRHRVGKGTGTVIEIVTASSGNGFTVVSNNTKWITGMQVVTSALSGFTGSIAASTYYVVRISSTNIRLATTLALAQAESPDVTISGSGSCTITATQTARTLGEYGGTETHAMTASQLYSHTHTQNSHTHTLTGAAQTYSGPSGTSNFSGGTAGNIAITQSAAATTATNQNTGGNVAMNVMQPFGTVMTIIKY